jgi:hypothetical protein
MQMSSEAVNAARLADLVSQIDVHARMAGLPPTGTPPVRTEAFEKPVAAFLTAPERERFTELLGLESAAIGAARSNNSVDAARAVEVMCALAARPSLSPCASLLFTSYAHSAAAYLQHRNGMLSEALLALRSALETTNALIDEHGVDALEERRILLGINWVRAHHRAGHADVAVTTAFQLLSYSEGDVANWPFAQRLRTPRRLDQPKYPGLINVLIGELAEALATDAAAVRPFLSTIGPHGEAPRPAACTRFVRAHAWLRAKRLGLDGSTGEFLEAAGEFVALGRRQPFILWDTVLLDVWQACSEPGLDPSGANTTSLARIARALPNVASALRETFTSGCVKGGMLRSRPPVEWSPAHA